MSGRRYTTEHEWILVDGRTGSVGISDYAQEQLGDVVYVELPEIGKAVKSGDEIAVVESVKAASEIYAPAAGKVVEVNQRLNDEPGLVNQAAEGDGWFLKLELEDAGAVEGLMDEAKYKKFLEGLE